MDAWIEISCIHPATTLEREISDIKSRLAENEEVRQIQEKFEHEKEMKNQEVKLAGAKKDEMKRQLLQNGYHFILKDTYLYVKSYLEQILVDQKDLIPLEVIEKSLNNFVCACCSSDLRENPEYLKHIEQLKTNFKRSELTPLISLITSSIHDFGLEEEEILSGISKNLKGFRDIKTNIEEFNKQLQDYKDEINIKAQEQENLKNLEANLKDKEKILHELGVEIEGANLQIKEKEKNKDALEKEFSRLLRANESLQVDSKVLEYMDALKQQFENVFIEYSDEMR